MDKFWIVFKKSFPCANTLIYKEEIQAEKEAKRLSELNPNESFYVLGTRSVCTSRIELNFKSLI